MRDLIVPSLVVLGLSAPLWIAWAVAQGPVDRKRLERFASRHDLTITARNGNQVIRYLATTRRWRFFGLACGLVVSVVWSLPNITVNSLYLFAGWFAGALFAELRVASLPRGTKKVALIAPRRIAQYLPTAARLLTPAAAVLCLVVGAFTRDLLWTGAGIVVGVVVWLIQRHVLRRAQPGAGLEEIAADDAIRSRSMHVLTGGGTALILYCVLGQLSEHPMVVIGVVSVPVLGYVVSTSAWRVARVR